VSLTQLVGTLNYISRRPEFELGSFYLSTLRVKFLSMKLLDKNKRMLKLVYCNKGEM
jgi:hypothetical protein